MSSFFYQEIIYTTFQLRYSVYREDNYHIEGFRFKPFLFQTH